MTDSEHSFDDTYTNDSEMFGKPYKELRTYFMNRSLKRKVLDLGCGQGRDALFLASLGYEVTAIDTSAVGVEQMLKHAKLQNLKITGIVDDISSLPIEEKFDVVLFDMVLHGFEEQQQSELLQKYTENLNGEGFFCIIFPDDIDTKHFYKILNAHSDKWQIIDEIMVKDIPQVGDEAVDFTFTMQCIKHLT